MMMAIDALTQILVGVMGWIFPQPRLTSSQLWALAAGGPLTQVNGWSWTSVKTMGAQGITGHRLKLLMMEYDEHEARQIIRANLREGWDVTNATTLRDTLKWLTVEGHRTEFKTLHRLLAKGSDSLEAQSGLRVAGLLGSATTDFICHNHGRFKNGDLIAWDFCRLINVARMGLSAEFLAFETEAWEVIIPAAQRLQREYASWDELCDNYMLGRSYWQEGAEPEGHLVEAANWLKTNPKSPWKKLRWSEPLT
jgi:Protein of unknown function (DUF1266)